MTDFIVFILVGGIAGWLAGQIFQGKGFGILANIIIGIIGSVLGGLLFGLLGFKSAYILGDIIISTVGAIILLYILTRIRRYRQYF